jgi:UDP-glucose:(heptosyl)LPS alpha-1,3-glucosyltransferase
MHPPYKENTGTVLLEALVAGLPVLATDVCGYAFHIEQAGSGLLVHSPFRQDDLNHKLEYMLTSNLREEWRRKALAYSKATDLFSMVERAVDIIENVVRRRSHAFEFPA